MRYIKEYSREDLEKAVLGTDHNSLGFSTATFDVKVIFPWDAPPLDLLTKTQTNYCVVVATPKVKRPRAIKTWGWVERVKVFVRRRPSPILSKEGL